MLPAQRPGDIDMWNRRFHSIGAPTSHLAGSYREAVVDAITSALGRRVGGDSVAGSAR